MQVYLERGVERELKPLFSLITTMTEWNATCEDADAILDSTSYINVIYYNIGYFGRYVENMCLDLRMIIIFLKNIHLNYNFDLCLHLDTQNVDMDLPK